MNDLDDDGLHGTFVRADRVEEIVEVIRGSDRKSDWKSGIELQLGPRRWRPPAVSEDGRRLLYVCPQSEIPRYVRERLKLAKENAVGVTIALTIGALFSHEVLEVLADTDSTVLVLDDYVKERRLTPRHFLAALADVEVPLPPEVRKSIGRKVWESVTEGTSQEKGSRLEAFLAFLFSQVSDFKVVERNYRNETEEIDLVLQVDNYSNRAWQKSGVPFILVEAKNTEARASQQMVSVLLAKIQTKRGTARIGVMVSRNGFTEEAKMQELRFSTQDVCIPMIDGTGVDSLLAADDLDVALETIVRRSLLR